MTRALPLLLLVLSASACGGDDDVADLGTADAALDESVFYGGHVPLPTIPNQGGPIIAAPQVTTFVWPGDEARGEVAEVFVSWLLTSAYWTESLAEYGVGAGTSKGFVTMPAPLDATIDYGALGALITNTLLTRPMNASSLPLFLVPSSTTVTIGGVAYCGNYGESYHYETFGTPSLPYVVILECPVGDPLTQRISHELTETAIDPLGGTMPAWTNPALSPYTEAADLCYSLNTVYTPTEAVGDAGPAPQSYEVTRIYSTKAATDGTHDPCVPAPAGKPYFNVALDPYALAVPAGSTGTFHLQPFAFADVGDVRWTIHGASGLTFSPSSGTTALGTSVEVTVKATASAAGDHGVFISTSTAAGDKNIALLAVTVQ